MPAARAPSMSSSGESPTIAASAGLDLEPPQHCLEDRRVRLRPPERARADRGVDLEPVVRDEGVQVAAGIRDEPELQALAAQLAEHGQRVLVELEVLGVLPRPRHLDGALVGASRRRRPSRG